MAFVRAKDGALLGVCKGLSKTLQVPVGLIRVLWILSCLFLGTGCLFYLLIALSFPREDRLENANTPWIMGVCLSLSKRTELDVGIVRLLCLLLAVGSLGATVFVYFILYFVLDVNSTQGLTKAYNSESRPS